MFAFFNNFTIQEIFTQISTENNISSDKRFFTLYSAVFNYKKNCVSACMGVPVFLLVCAWYLWNFGHPMLWRNGGIIFNETFLNLIKKQVLL